MYESQTLRGAGMRNAVSTGAAAEDPPRGYIRASYLAKRGLRRGAFFMTCPSLRKPSFSQIKLQASGTSLVNPRKLYGFGDVS